MVFYFICNEQFCFRWAARGSMKIIWTMWNCVLVKVDIVLPWTNTFGAYKADYWFGCFAQRRTWYSQSIVYFYIFFFIVFFCFISPQTNVNDKRMGRQHQRRPNKKKQRAHTSVQQTNVYLMFVRLLNSVQLQVLNIHFHTGSCVKERESGRHNDRQRTRIKMCVRGSWINSVHTHSTYG